MSEITHTDTTAGLQAPPRKSVQRHMSDSRIVQLFILPTIILLILMNIFPLIYSLFLSFTNYSVISGAAPEWIGIENYQAILSDPQFWHNFAVTGRYALISVSLQTIIGFGLAMLLRSKFAGSGLTTTLILVPMMLSPIVVATFWQLILNPSLGIFNYAVGYVGTILIYAFSLLGFLVALFGALAVRKRFNISQAGIIIATVVVGIIWFVIFNPNSGVLSGTLETLKGYSNPNTSPEWLGEPNLALWAIIIVDVWMWSPFVMLLCLAGLSAIPEYLYEAAAIDRASAWFQFWRITLPQVMPLLLIAVLFRTIEAFKQFDIVMGLTGGGPGDVTKTVSVQLYQLAFQGVFDTGKSSALAYIVLVIIIAVSNLYIRALNKVRGG